ncbi:MAG: glucokinase [Maricaulaceae bacterium]|jgi:glucokinase
MSALDASPIVVGDIGGTNVRFALARRAADGARVLGELFAAPADGFADFEDALAVYVETLDQPPRLAAFAVAGPVDGDPVALTNRAWRVDRAGLARRFGFERVVLVNDFAAAARGAPEASSDGFVEIKSGVAHAGAPLVVGGPGTGFGLATVAPANGGWLVLGGEGGHQTFPARTAFEWSLVLALRAKFEHVSIEVMTGGLHAEAVREAVCALLGEPFKPMAPAEVLAAAAASEGACRTYCALRAAASMAALGDAALLAGARGGAVAAGGVSVALKDYLRAPEALARFEAHGPMSNYLAEIPVRLLTDQSAALIGAARLCEEAG